jgi:hypothetical protein
LPSGSYRCLPSAHVRVTRRGRKSKSVSVIICVRNSSLRTQSWIDSAAPAMCGEFRAYEDPARADDRPNPRLQDPTNDKTWHSHARWSRQSPR